MKFTRLYIRGYGCFADREFCFREGLNLIYGPNEAGKSTVLKFILAMLYGHKKPGLRRSSYLEEQEAMLPWQGEAFGGTMEYVAGDIGYRVERDLRKDREEVRVFELATGRELTGEFPVDSRRENLFAEVHLGLNRSLFEQTACVRQLGLKGGSAQAVELATRLLNLQSARDEEISVQRAISFLQAGLDGIGSSKAPSRPYARTAERIKELGKRVAELRAEREELMKYEAALSLARTGSRKLAGSAERPVFILKSIGPQVLQGQWERAMKLAQRLEDLTFQLRNLTAFREFPWEYRDELLQVTARAEELGGEIPGGERRYGKHKAGGEEQIRELEARLRELQDEEGKLHAAKTGWRGNLTRVLAVALTAGAVSLFLAVLVNPWFWLGAGAAGIRAVLAFWEQGRVERELNRLREEIKRIQVSKRAAEILHVAGVSDLEAFLSGCRQRKVWEEAVAEKEQVWEHLKSILAAAVNNLEDRVEEFNRVGQELLDAVRELEESQAELTRLSREREALELAVRCLQEASEEIHRDFAPRLNTRIGALIKEITGGRYSQVRVDRSLNLRVLAPETGRLVPLTALSSGTADQFSLSLRLAVAGLLTGGRGGLPLILDDSFVQWDDRRLEGALAHLLELARVNQILLFTCQQRELDILARLSREGEGYTVIHCNPPIRHTTGT